MARIATYVRPSSLHEALELLESTRAVVIGGGTTLPTRPIDGAADVVDLQDVGLGGIEPTGDRVRMGAMATLDEVSRSELLPEVVRDAARREMPSTLRTHATLGGLVASAGADSELLALLLVHDAVVSVVTRQAREDLLLEAYFGSLPRPRGEIVTAVTVAVDGTAAAARTARTPADRPIVAAAARSAPDGTRHLALSGVAATPVAVPTESAGAATTPAAMVRAAGLHPPGDFRGSSEYRKALAEVLSARVLEEVS